MRRNHSAEGISSLGTILSLAGLLVVIVIIAVAVSISLPSNNNDTTTTTTSASTATTSGGAHQANTPPQSTTTTGPGLPGTGGAAAVAACQSDVTALTTALAAYQATNGSYPTPPAGWTFRPNAPPTVGDQPTLPCPAMPR